MKAIFRYRTMKPTDGHFSFDLYGGASILSFTEFWHTDKGWEVVLDVLVDTSVPRERRCFFLCTGGDNLDFIGEPELYHVGTHESKSYVSYLFDTSHLSEQERAQGKAKSHELKRKAPARDELAGSQRRAAARLRAV